MPNWLQRISGLLSGARPAAAPEGQPRSGPYYLPISQGWLSDEAGSNLNWWQLGHNVQRGGGTAMVEACVSAYAQTTAMCPGNHWLLKDDGGRERVATSALTRWLKKPNAYQSISDYLLNTVYGVFHEGNSYALALRNNRSEIVETHLMDPRLSGAMVAENGEAFYHLGGNEIVERMIGTNIIVPARDVLHIRLHTPRHPLVGETPITSAALQIAASNAAMSEQIMFLANRRRPSFVLTTDQMLTVEQAAQLRARWDEQSKGLNAGGVPILSAGLKPETLGVSAQDAQLIDLLKLSDQAVAMVLRVPLDMFGLSRTPFASTEALMQFWLASGLGFLLNHTEEAIGNLFRLAGQPDEYLELDTSALQRSNFKDRIEGYARATQGGIYSPDEARAEFEKPKVPGGFGKEPRVQQQVVPLSAWDKKLNAPKPAPALPPPAGSGAPPAVPPPPKAPPPAKMDQTEIAAALDVVNTAFERIASNGE